MAAETIRDFSVYATWIEGAPRSEYAKVRATERVIAPGRCIEVQREGQTTWLPAVVTESPASNPLGSIVFARLRLTAT